MNKLLEVKNLTTQFNIQNKIINAVNDISFSLHNNEVLGIVGESGSGKSVTVRSILRIINYILDQTILNDLQLSLADMNYDSEVNVQDIVLLVNEILD